MFFCLKTDIDLGQVKINLTADARCTQDIWLQFVFQQDRGQVHSQAATLFAAHAYTQSFPGLLGMDYEHCKYFQHCQATLLCPIQLKWFVVTDDFQCMTFVRPVYRSVCVQGLWKNG